VGRGERLWRWGRRNPTAAALVATAVGLVGLASGGGVWLVQQRARHDAEMRNDVVTAVAQAESLRKGVHFREARALLEQARQRLEPAGPDDLRPRVEKAQADLNLADRLDAARIKSATLAGGVDAPAAIESLYDSVFAETGLGGEGDDIKAVAGRVRDSALSAELIAALDDWASVASDPLRREWLLAAAREADPDPARNRLRRSALWTDPMLWNDPKVMDQLTQDLKAADFSPQLAIALSRAADEFHVDSVPLLTAAQTRFPQDFWLNAGLGSSLAEASRWHEALGYYRAALALRPDASAAHGCLGCALYKTGRRDEAVGYFEQALLIDPESVLAHGNLAIVLHEKGRTDEAMGHFQQALRIDPKSGGVHFNLGTALLATGQLDDAIDQFQQTVSINPKSAIAHYNLGIALYKKRRLDEAIDQFQQAVRIDPKFAKAYNNLGVALWEKGRPEEAIEPFQQAVRIDPKYPQGPTNLGNALHSAARDALRAAAAEGSEKERAAKRRQALAWLRADLELTTTLIRDGKVSPQSVANLQIYPALEGVRNQAALATLPDAEREEWQRFWADVEAVVAPDPVAQGRMLAARRDWTQAADCYARALARGPTDDGRFWFEYAALLLLSGDRPGYEKACAHLLDRCGKVKGLRSYHVARACSLAPDAAADMSLPGRLAEKELQGSPEFWSLTEQGALAYRAGRFKDAVPLFEQSVRDNRKPGAAVVNYLWLALARQRLGKIEEARRFLGTAGKWLDQYGDGMPARAETDLGLDLHNWLEAHVLRTEAEALISQPKAP
jgi:tetratricopeptide (TPR) repeat protein